MMKFANRRPSGGRAAVTLLAAIGTVGVASLALMATPDTTLNDVQRDAEISTLGTPLLLIGPVAGLTEGWHKAPKGTGVPVGTVLQFAVNVPPHAQVTWSGAVEVTRDGGRSTAVCPVAEVGREVVEVAVRLDGELYRGKSMLDVLDVDVADIRVTGVNVTTGSLQIDEDLSQDELNEATMAAFFGSSVAPLRQLDDGTYLTSVDRPIPVETRISPKAFMPLVELRVDGQPRLLGSKATAVINQIGEHTLSIGPPAAAYEVEVETYRVEITSHVAGVDYITEGEPIVFTAVTEPAGRESEIVWLSSTKFGTAEPVTGTGPMFVCEFNDTFGPHPDGGPWQWMGVKAGNYAFGQDQKEFACCFPDGSCQNATPEVCAAVGGFPFPPPIRCQDIICEPPVAYGCECCPFGADCIDPELNCLYEVTQIVGDTVCTGCNFAEVGSVICLSPCPPFQELCPLTVEIRVFNNDGSVCLLRAVRLSEFCELCPPGATRLLINELP